MRLRRSRCLTCYWHDGEFVVHPHPHGTSLALHPAAAEILTAFEDWSTPENAAGRLGHLTRDTVDEAVATLTGAGALLAQGSPAAHRDEEIAGQWGAWMPEASFFHYATSDVYDAGPAGEVPDTADGGAGDSGAEPAEGPLPALFTSHPHAPRLLLPRRPAPLRAPLGEVLYDRRTHRDFSGGPVPLDTLAALLATVFGPVDFIDCGRGALYRRTSPQGGSRQEIDAYVGVLGVDGLSPGWYHYDGLSHALELLSEGFTPEEAAHLCADQAWAARPAFFVVLAARLERMSVKYPTPRAYRVCLLDAGHLGQTFALTATALGLGPAQTGAFRDSVVAGRCGLDNTDHTPLYVLAAGHPAPVSRDAPPPAGVTAFGATALTAP
ncbi:SagB/ThcOx family dehydrogenase [Streptomyces sp. NBC_00385]|uniref:SagB/ThcOx family dehydrogenase n=1 Tax=Streptomyces sp. NBC_00385 TaxID=2975733 RepID=UPI002DDC7E24|nr:SagB/ThcOx family dehydrogenase [Streptomyces sp. NBC_00385]WRZ07289.1 SagB/ThcOx family dehydrogenase [Streptomyces sp. NBC_00385]